MSAPERSVSGKDAEPRRTYESSEVARLLGVTARTVTNLVSAGKLHPVPNPVRVWKRFYADEVEALAATYVPRRHPHWAALQRLVAAHPEEFKSFVDAEKLGA